MMRIAMCLLCCLLCAGGCAQTEKKKQFYPSPFREEGAGQAVRVPAAQNNDPAAWDFGIVARDTVVKHEFTVSNTSNRTMTIKDVVTSCGCTASEVTKKVLAPGEATAVAVSFNSKGYSGAVSQFVYINTDDPDNPVLKLTIKASVQ